MGNTVTNELRTFFAGDASGFEKASGKVNAAIQENIKREQEAQKLFSRRADATKGALLDPLATAGRGADKLVKSLKLSSLSAGVLGAGVTLAAAAFRKANDFAGQSADRMNAISEQMRQTSRLNIFATSADGVDSLSEKLSTLRGQALDQRGAIREADPYGFGGGVGGNMLTAFSDMQTSLKSAVGLGPYSNFDRQEDEKKMAEQRLRINAQEQAKLTKLRSQATVDDLRVTRERLTADRQTVEITALELEKIRAIAKAKQDQLSPADQNRVAQRFDLQLAAAREEESFASKRNFLAAGLLGIQASASSEAAKQIRAAEKTQELNREELRTRQFITTERRRELTLENLASENTVTRLRREMLMGKSPQGVNNMVFRNRQHETAVARFDKVSGRTDGLINVQRDMSGNVTLGLDPITGKWRKPASGMGKAEVGLHSGSLSDPATSVGGGASLIRDTDAGGGLHSGNTPRMFERTSAAERLDKPTAASVFLDSHTGDLAHDPAARLANAPIWRNLSGGDRSTLAGARAALDNTNRMRTTGAAFLSASAPKFNAPNALSQAAIQLSAKKLEQERATTEAVRRVHEAIQMLPEALSFQ